MWDKIKNFIVGKPTSDIADDVRKRAYEEERIRLAEMEGKAQARAKSKLFMEQTTTKQKIEKPQWESKLESLSDAIEHTFKSSSPVKKQKVDGDGVSPTFTLYKESPSKSK